MSRSSNGIWTAAKWADLKDAPRVGLVEPDGSILIATIKRLIRVHPDKSEEVLVSDAFWWALYPNSIVRTSAGDIYLGMRHGIVRLKAGVAGKTEWLLPNKQFIDAKPRF